MCQEMQSMKNAWKLKFLQMCFKSLNPAERNIKELKGAAQE